MTIQILISTMHQKDKSLLDSMNISTPAVVINQCDKEGVENLTHRDCEILWVNTKERGLSKSRNMALRHATADICVLADDDMIYRDDYGKEIEKAFCQECKADIIGFEVIGIERLFKKYPTEAQKIGFLKSLRMASVELAFRREVIQNADIRFDERLGAGTKYRMGEENAFLFHCLKKKCRVQFLPVPIADLHMGNSSWFHGWTEEYFVGRGAAFAGMDKTLTHFLMLQWAIRKYKVYKNEMGFWRGLRLMNKGRREYQRDVKEGKV